MYVSIYINKACNSNSAVYNEKRTTPKTSPETELVMEKSAGKSQAARKKILADN